MLSESLPGARIPSATYRLQFNEHFTFDDAREIAGYLNDLGISDLYASSYLAAKKGSVHGYDVVNQTLLNPEVGNEESYRALFEELERLGMGHILDIVPNHMCIDSSENLWWMDVLENGMSSSYARFFDIDWAPVKKELTGKVLLPFLSDQYGRVLENGELRLEFQEGAFQIDCSGMRIPVEPKSYLCILGHRPDRLHECFSPESPPLLELLSIETALQHLPPADEQDPQRQEERHREKEIIKRRLRALCEASPEMAAFIGENVQIFNGSRGDPSSFDLLDGLLRGQVYRLSFWRVATEEINYRRFFDINGLAAIRMEEQAVFDQTHQLLLRLIREGKVTGVRIDHVDGLYDPITYLQGLQKSCFMQLTADRAGNDPGEAGVGAAGTGAKETDGAGTGMEGTGEASAADDAPVPQGREALYRQALERDPAYKPFYAVCEKILMKGEQLPERWPVFGTTGYDFLASLNGVFVDTENAKDFDRIYRGFVGAELDFPEVVYEKKKLVMQVSLSGEVNMLAHHLNTISEQDRLTRDFTLNSMAHALAEVIACFPVYRTYANSATLRDKDVLYIEAAVGKAKRRNPAISASIFDFLRDVLLLRFPERATQENRTAWLNFAMRFQQITGPVMAKGMEDTSFYVYSRLVSLNEVGGMPGRFGTTLEAFHGQNRERLKIFPHAMLATATHDSKRGEDVRTRIDALSEIPERWRKAVAKWRRLNKGKAVLLDNQTVPDRNEEYLLYQTLVGSFPAVETDPAAFAGYRARIGEYAIKAAREAKMNTSWVSPNAAYEEALTQFVDRILFDSPGNGFLAAFRPLLADVARWGAFSSLSQVLLKMVSPGVPDFYQGSELWDFTLVDPDNRRPIDYATRREALAGLQWREGEIGPQAFFRELLEKCWDGRIKLYLIYRVLNYRRRHRDLFDRGDYLPLEVRGGRSGHVCAYARRVNDEWAIVAAPRLVATLVPEPNRAPVGEGVWLDGVLLLPEGAPVCYRNIINDSELEAVAEGGRQVLPLSAIFAEAPVALLEVRV